MNAPTIPMMIVTMIPPGSLPGMMALAMIPAMRPRTIHAMIPIRPPFVSLLCAPERPACPSGDPLRNPRTTLCRLPASLARNSFDWLRHRHARAAPRMLESDGRRPLSAGWGRNTVHTFRVRKAVVAR